MRSGRKVRPQGVEQKPDRLVEGLTRMTLDDALEGFADFLAIEHHIAIKIAQILDAAEFFSEKRCAVLETFRPA